MTKLGQIFTAGVSNDITVALDGVADSKILDPVGTSAYQVPGLSVDAAKPNLQVFDLTASLDASSTAQASINAASAEIAPFDASEPLTAPQGSSYAQLVIDGNLSGSFGGTLKNAPLTVSASAAPSFTYTHWTLASATETRLDALTRLVTSAQLPQYENITSLLPGEATRFGATLQIDLGAQAQYGDSFDLDKAVSLFDGLSAQLTASVAYQIKASLGWSLYDEMDVVVANAQQNHAGWVRVRIDRTRNDTFTAGATFALNVAYDASSIADALEKAFQASSLPLAIQILTTVAKGDWDAIKSSISERATNDLIAAIAGTGWKEEAANSPAVTEAIADINKVVSIYNGVDAKVQQLWNSLLLKVDLQPGSDLRNTIDKIAALDPQNPNLQQFLSPEAQKDLQMLEALSGKSIEQLLVGSNASVSIAITSAVNLAKQLERVINDTPTEIMSALTTFSQEHGIASIIQWLATNATSLDAIQAWGDSEIKNVVTKAVGKAWNLISPADLQTVQTWAQKIVAQWTDLSTKLANAAKYLQGTLGFNLSAELSRASQWSAVLDFEVDPTNAAAVTAVRANLPKGNVHDMLVALDSVAADAWSIRESVMTSRRLKTGVSTALLSLLGLSRTQTVSSQTFTESVVQITDAGRSASYSGGFTQSVTIGSTSSECSVSAVAEGADASHDSNAPFANPSQEIHLTFSRNDSTVSATTLQALQTLLEDLGFFVTAGEPATDTPAGSETAFTIDIVLDANALAQLAHDDGERNWNGDFRNAAYRLFNDAMVAGQEFATVLRSDVFAETWTDTSTTEFRQDPRANGIPYENRTLGILDDNLQFTAEFIPVRMLITRRPGGFGELDKLQTALANPGNLKQLAEGGAAFFSKAMLREWNNPMFTLWFTIARLCRMSGAALATAKGLATLRSRQSSTDAFGAPMQWSLTAGTGVPCAQIKARRLFPFGS
ncbi:MAG TPA: hypothetical protein VJZ76_00455 [Thermoanaerobaculia bacterium]|nr:hypothetical protein [Thermoanaerobaculia bacterium]